MRPRFSRHWFLVLLSATLLVFAATARAATPPVNIGDVIVTTSERPIKISVAGSTADLNGFARHVFGTHGRYAVVTAAEAQYDLRFTSVAPKQVRVDVRNQAGVALFSQTADGTSDRNALFRAADLAVKATSRLNGFFASRLAFVSTRTGKDDIYVGDVFLSEVTPITADHSAVPSLRWSPDGGRLIFTSYYKNNRPDIYLHDLATGRTDVFASLEGTNTGARFSPDGRQVAMVLTGEGPSEIYVGDPQGRTRVRLTRSDTIKSSPSWSPDGLRILYSGDPGPQLRVISAAGGAPQTIDIGGLSSYAAEPDWSRADPDKIAFTVRAGKNYQVAVASVSGSKPAKIVSGKIPVTDVQEPVWLADGRHLICTAKAANVRLLYLLDTETGKATRLDQSGAFGESSRADVWGP